MAGSPPPGRTGDLVMPTVLIVDDHPVNRNLLVTLLGYSGHTLLEACDGG